jgi:hypothetical protein
MPARTTVRFADAAGTERLAIRERGDIPRDEDGQSIELVLADLGQDESGHVASTYRTQPLKMLAYLDSFCQLDKESDAGLAGLVLEGGFGERAAAHPPTLACYGQLTSGLKSANIPAGLGFQIQACMR